MMIIIIVLICDNFALP